MTKLKTLIEENACLIGELKYNVKEKQRVIEMLTEQLFREDEREEGRAMSKFTPGPWISETKELSAADKMYVWADIENGPFICELSSHGQFEKEEMKANAQAIAALPELVAACKTMAEYIALQWDDAPDDEPAFMFDVRMALAKVEGK